MQDIVSNGHHQAELTSLRSRGLLRSLRALPNAGGIVRFHGQNCINFSSNDYLNLANDPRLKEAAKRGIDEFGCGATASRLMTGNLDIHEQLEFALATLTGKEAALVLPSGFQTNQAVLTTILDGGGAIFSDQLNHASIIDGARLSRAAVHVYPHLDMTQLEDLLIRNPSDRTRLIVSDSVFSMDGDLAHVEELAAIAQRHGALLMIDEAHAIGVFGKGGGLCRERGVHADIVVGTLSKSLGSAGGFVATTSIVREYLVNKARPLIFSTGLAPACAAAGLEAIRIIEETPGLGADLIARSLAFNEALQQSGLDVPITGSQVVPLTIGANADAVRLSNALLERGVLAIAVRPPSVPEGTARLRLSVTLAHSTGMLLDAATTIASATQEISHVNA